MMNAMPLSLSEAGWTPLVYNCNEIESKNNVWRVSQAYNATAQKKKKKRRDHSPFLNNDEVSKGT